MEDEILHKLQTVMQEALLLQIEIIVGWEYEVLKLQAELAPSLLLED